MIVCYDSSRNREDSGSISPHGKLRLENEGVFRLIKSNLCHFLVIAMKATP